MILAILTFVLLLWLTQGGNIGKRITILGETDSIEELIGAELKDEDGDGTYEWTFSGESRVEYISVSSSGGYVLNKDSRYSIDNITSYCDYNFQFISSTYLEDLQTLITAYNNYANEHNATLEEGAERYITIKYNEFVVGPSWWESILPYASVIIVVILGFVLIKSILGANSKSFSFGRTKAQVTQKTNVTFNDVAGIDEEKEELQEIVEFLKNPQKYTELGAKIPKGILLVGLPGTGKTLLAKAIAGESNVPFFSISGSDFVEMFVGVGASRVRDLFEQAKREAPCIVFIDEIDDVGRDSGCGLGSGNEEREETLNQLLVQMDGFEGNTGVIVIAATNRADVLDPALLRPGRFDRQIYVNPPDVKGREMILKIHARNKPIDESVDFKNLARLTSGFTGADIENLLNEAAILTARDNRHKITMTDITESINKVIMGPQKRSRVVTENDKRITACHESGHAIIGKVLPHCDVVQEVSIVSRGMAAGYTISRPEDDNMHMSYNKLIDNITMMLGGRAAEELMIKDISTGASNDIERATKIARKMVTEWGMSTKLGTINFGSTSEVFIGRDYQTQVSYSEETASEIDKEIKKIIESCYAKAKEIIKEHQTQMNIMIELLLEKETIYFKEIELIMKGKTTKQILNAMAKEEIRNKAKVEIERAEADLERAKKEQVVRLKTAEALRKGGVITDEEIKNIKLDSEQTIKQAEEKVERIKNQYQKKPKKSKTVDANNVDEENKNKEEKTEKTSEFLAPTKEILKNETKIEKIEKTNDTKEDKK